MGRALSTVTAATQCKTDPFSGLLLFVKSVQSVVQSLPLYWPSDSEGGLDKRGPGNYADIEAIRKSWSANVSDVSQRKQGGAAGSSAGVDHLSNRLGCIEQNMTFYSPIPKAKG